MNESAAILVFPRRPGETIKLKPHFVSSDAYARMNEVVAGRLEPDPVRVLGEAVTWPLRPQKTIKWLCLEDSRSVIAEGLTDADLVAFRAAGIPCVRNDLLVVASASQGAAGQSSGADPLWWKSHVGDLQESKRGEGVLIAFPDTGFASDTYPETAARIANAWHHDDTLPLQETKGNATDNATDHHGTRVAYMASEIATNANLLICRILNKNKDNKNTTRIANLTNIINIFKKFAQECNKALIICFSLAIRDKNGHKTNDYPELNDFKNAIISSLCETPENNSSYGLVIVAAIGNTEDDDSNIPALPGSLQFVIGVGSHNSNNVAKGCCAGAAVDNPEKSKPDFYAPGIEVGIPGLGGMNGTSFAAAVLAGIVAARISDDMSLVKDNQRLRELLLRDAVRITHGEVLGASPRLGSASA